MSADMSPNGLQLTPKPNVARMGRWPLYMVIIAGFVLAAALIYSVNFAHNETEEEETAGEVIEEKKTLFELEGRGLAQAPKMEQTSGVLTPEVKQEPIVIVQQNTKEQERIDEEAQNIRRTRTQAYLSALSAPLAVRRETSSSRSTGQISTSDSESAGRKNAISSDGAAGTDGYYDPAADRDKEAFFERAKTDTSWALHEQRTAGLPFELKTGTVVPGVMVTGINSDLPGNMIAQVAQNVFDTATGRNLLIPKGTKVYGVYDSRVIYGQERVLIAWNRLIFPDGSSINLGAMPGADMGGNAGFHDQVNNHYLRIFGSAIMMSLVTGGMAYAMDSANNDVGTTENGTSLQDEMTSALAAQLGQTTTTLLQKNLNIKPTLEIRPGYQFNIVITKDMAFKQPYQAWRR